MAWTWSHWSCKCIIPDVMTCHVVSNLCQSLEPRQLFKPKSKMRLSLNIQNCGGCDTEPGCCLADIWQTFCWQLISQQWRHSPTRRKPGPGLVVMWYHSNWTITPWGISHTLKALSHFGLNSSREIIHSWCLKCWPSIYSIAFTHWLLKV